jgi:hypothetical protein
MSNNNDVKKTIPQNTIPTSKLAVILNNFIVNTTNHLNKLSVNVDEKLSEFDKKMNDLEIMTTLFESKLESLPDEIKSTFPPLQPCNLDDVNPSFSASNVNPSIQQGNNPAQAQNENQENKENQEGENKEGNEEEEKKEEQPEEEKELTPEDELNKFLEEHEDVRQMYKMLKLGVPSFGVMQKAQMNGYDINIVQELIDKAKKVNPNIQ